MNYLDLKPSEELLVVTAGNFNPPLRHDIICIFQRYEYDTMEKGPLAVVWPYARMYSPQRFVRSGGIARTLGVFIL